MLFGTGNANRHDYSDNIGNSQKAPELYKAVATNHFDISNLPGKCTIFQMRYERLFIS